jgi:flagellar biosynthesis protein FlhB
MTTKTEPPTPRKLRRARQEGDSPVSSALIQAASFIVVVALAPSALSVATQRATAMLKAAALGHPPPTPTAIALEVSLFLVPLLGAGALTAAAVGMVQTGGIFAAGKLAPNLGRANPIAGLKNLFSWQRAVAVVRSLVAAILVGAFAVHVLRGSAGSLARVVGQPQAALALSGSLLHRLVWFAAGVGLGLALVDLLVTRFAWLHRHRMSRHEVAQEHKDTEGDPQIKAARRRAHEQLLMSATVAAVRDATVLVVNPTHLAMALRYVEGQDEAPKLIGHGRGELAHRMIEAARTYGVPVVRDIPLARALSELETGDEIPEALYEAVAEILREIYSDSEQHESRV